MAITNEKIQRYLERDIFLVMEGILIICVPTRAEILRIDVYFPRFYSKSANRSACAARSCGTIETVKAVILPAGAALSQDSIRGFSEREAEMPSFLKSKQPTQSW